ncbi:MAG: hypothetical protein JWQ11_4664, partial [Rhizobacter sp.]|nr:hypothetical protein [Rhizobacter sp.]
MASFKRVSPFVNKPANASLPGAGWTPRRADAVALFDARSVVARAGSENVAGCAGAWRCLSGGRVGLVKRMEFEGVIAV